MKVFQLVISKKFEGESSFHTELFDTFEKALDAFKVAVSTAKVLAPNKWTYEGAYIRKTCAEFETYQPEHEETNMIYIIVGEKEVL